MLPPPFQFNQHGGKFARYLFSDFALAVLIKANGGSKILSKRRLKLATFTREQIPHQASQSALTLEAITFVLKCKFF
jgi:hypothetical protein